MNQRIIRYVGNGKWECACTTCGKVYQKNLSNIRNSKHGNCRECYLRLKRENGLSAEHRLKIGQSRIGSKNPMWAGDRISKDGARNRARSMYPAIGVCERCGSEKAERHHKDGNPINNVPSNISVLCRKCHMKSDGRMDNWQKMCHQRKGVPKDFWPRKRAIGIGNSTVYQEF